MQHRTLDDNLPKPYPYQEYSSLCGPAAFLYSLLKDNPTLYKKYIMDLWENGEANLGTLKVKPSYKSRHPHNYTYPTGKTRVPAIDWIGMASLRDSENIFSSYSSPDDTGAGITMWGDIERWFKAVGSQKIFDNITLLGSNLADACNLGNYTDSKHHVITLIGAGMLKNGEGTMKDHWIVWEGKPFETKNNMPITVKTKNEEDLQLNLFSWGEIGNQLNDRETLKHFLAHLFGGMVFSKIP